MADRSATALCFGHRLITPPAVATSCDSWYLWWCLGALGGRFGAVQQLGEWDTLEDGGTPERRIAVDCRGNEPGLVPLLQAAAPKSAVQTCASHGWPRHSNCLCGTSLPRGRSLDRRSEGDIGQGGLDVGRRWTVALASNVCSIFELHVRHPYASLLATTALRGCHETQHSCGGTAAIGRVQSRNVSDPSRCICSVHTSSSTGLVIPGNRTAARRAGNWPRGSCYSRSDALLLVLHRGP